MSQEPATANPADPALSLGRHWKISGTATVIVLIAGAIYLLATREGEPVCTEDAGRHLLGAWDRSQRAAVGARVGALGEPAAAAAWAQTAAALDDHAETWTIAYSTTCDGLAKEGEDDPALLAQRRCLQWRLRQLATTAEVLRGAEPAILRASGSAVRALDPIENCETPRRAARARPWSADAATARRVQTVRIRLEAQLIRDRAGLENAIELLGAALGEDSDPVVRARKELATLDATSY